MTQDPKFAWCFFADDDDDEDEGVSPPHGSGDIVFNLNQELENPATDGDPNQEEEVWKTQQHHFEWHNQQTHQNILLNTKQCRQVKG